MKNPEIEAAWAYHNGTKHSYQSIRTNPHYLDWENQPIPFKIYPQLKPIPLPQHLSSSGMLALSAISAIGGPAESEVRLTCQILAEILYLSAGVTKRRSYPGGEMLFRAAACTGALYHIDLYLVCGDLEDLEAGVYHFGPHDFALRRLRQGDCRAVLVCASGREPSMVNAPAVLICASTYWRNAWKYQARAYRHCYWDNGTIMANLLAAAAARKVLAKVVVGFVDAAVTELLSLDSKREAPLSLVALGHTPSQAAAFAPSVEPLAFETVSLSKKEIDYPVMRAMHEASSLESEEEVRAWRGGREKQGGRRKDENEKEEQLFLLQPSNDDDMPQNTIEEVIIRRGSTRQFSD
ncbi:MAG TPA: SagB/ThcOx family dehydrogenase, partial [Candidatus Binatia bacterium]|nr:SagB/ThcOx family dehydrogenase [Candidatus Binatia bacterium]